MSGYFQLALEAADVVAELAEQDPNVVALAQDFGPLRSFTERFPERHFDLGITEEGLIGVAAGMAHAGKLPFVFAMAPFITMHAFEQIRDDCAYNRNPVKIIAPFAGLEAAAWGATHHAIEDIAFMRGIPGMTVLSPADPAESLRAVRAAAKLDGPVYIRIGVLSPLEGYQADFQVGQAITMREGRDVTLVATGSSLRVALAVHEMLRSEGVSLRVLNMHTIKPLDQETIERAVRETGRLVTLEEHFRNGGLGGAVAEILAERGQGRLLRLGIRDVFCTEVAPYEDLLRIHELDAENVAKQIRTFLGD